MAILAGLNDLFEGYFLILFAFRFNYCYDTVSITPFILAIKSDNYYLYALFNIREDGNV